MAPFITVDGQDTISLAQAFRYLQRTGELDSVISSIMKQYLLEREFRQRTDLAIAPTEIEQQVLNFRQQNQLTDSFQYREWLQSQGLNEEQLHEQIAMELRLYKFREWLASTQLQEYFIERKLFLDQVVLSRIVVTEQELADELYLQLKDGASFENLAREYSITEDRLFNGMFGTLSRGNLPDDLRAAIDTAMPGTVLTPIPVEDNWYIFRLEHVLPANLDDPNIRQGLQNELLERWLVDQLQHLDVDIQVGDD
ncbi:MULTISPECIES: peptidylprolyl isomerase [unclassified Leptolyngbya]|uniref:peptidylprolyl isomerase n=1 Tax=unclassified Leptolyngbya TaxID=2650499 RepID=UPI001686660D|nr:MULTISPECIES: peptidylprolyl isomerase [unclassified Leptolyngbya]MBD1910098.1 peptidyl-prolyl cis-trans isomerase [Leptolyngbya sp. FACHB-8]MBD2156870.1 peptidyl-prolyl cis-trans isomerase [Leptolyngbya sp. FACHB-16]